MLPSIVIGALSLLLVIVIVFIARTFAKPRKETAGQSEEPETEREERQSLISQPLTKSVLLLFLEVKKRWSSWLLLCAGIIILAEGLLLVKLDRDMSETTRRLLQVERLLGTTFLPSLSVPILPTQTMVDRIVTMEKELGITQQRGILQLPSSLQTKLMKVRVEDLERKESNLEGGLNDLEGGLNDLERKVGNLDYELNGSWGGVKFRVDDLEDRVDDIEQRAVFRR